VFAAQCLVDNLAGSQYTPASYTGSFVSGTIVLRRQVLTARGPAGRLKGRPARFGIFVVVRYFFTRSQPPESRILLVESGSRHLLEDLLPGIRETYGDAPVDLVTCYGGLPRGFEPAATHVYRVTDYRGRAARRTLFRELAARRYTILGMICSDEPVMTKWKWALAWRLPAKVFALNENGDYFWLDWGHLAVMRNFVLFRAGLAGAGAVRTLGRFFLFPFTLAYLVLYATAIHIRRAWRTGSWRVRDESHSS